MELSEVEKAYIAGIVDGEGCIRFGSRKARLPIRSYRVEFYPTVIVANTNLALTEFLRQKVGGSVTLRKQPFGKNWKPISFWVITTKTVYSFLTQVTPFLRLKKAQSELVFEFQKTFEKSTCYDTQKTYGKKVFVTHTLKPSVYHRRLELVEKMHFLNKRGL